MPESESTRGLVAARDSAGAVELFTRPEGQIKFGSRLGVWGLVGGLGSMTAFTLGVPISLTAAIAVMGGGVLLSGVGVLLAATGALRSTRDLPGPIRAAAFAALPLGAVLGLLGVTSLTQWGPLVSVVNALTPAAGVLGALVVLLLVVAFFVGLPDDDEGESPADGRGAP